MVKLKSLWLIAKVSLKDRTLTEKVLWERDSVT